MEVSIFFISSSMAARSEDIPLCWVAKEAMLVPAPATPRLSKAAIVSVEIGFLFFLFLTIFVFQYEYRLSSK
jgi:hypothetical protein